VSCLQRQVTKNLCHGRSDVQRLGLLPNRLPCGSKSLRQACQVELSHEPELKQLRFADSLNIILKLVLKLVIRRFVQRLRFVRRLRLVRRLRVLPVLALLRYQASN
jgi:hypothetical protein